jgi:hypothetical protein
MPTLFESRKPKACRIEKQQYHNPDRIHRPQREPVVNRKKFVRASHRGRRNQGLHGGQVRVMHERELSSRERLSKVAGGSPGWLDFLCGVKKLQGLEDELQDPVEYRSAWELIAPTFGFDPKKAAAPKDLKKSLLLPALAVAFEGVRLTFWWTRPDKQGKQQLLPGLYCPETQDRRSRSLVARSQSSHLYALPDDLPGQAAQTNRPQH